jgi:hypothetical protein
MTDESIANRIARLVAEADDLRTREQVDCEDAAELAADATG